MFDEECSGPSDWKKRQEAVDKKLALIGKKSDIAADISKRKTARKSNQENIEIISTLSYEAQDQLRSGKMSLKEVIEDLCDAFKAMLTMDKGEVKEEKEEKEDK